MARARVTVGLLVRNMKRGGQVLQLCIAGQRDQDFRSLTAVAQVGEVLHLDGMAVDTF